MKILTIGLKICCFCGYSFAATTTLAAQCLSVIGQVTDVATGQPLEGVSIYVRNAGRRALLSTSQINGGYSLSLPCDSATLVVEKTGYRSSTIPFLTKQGTVIAETFYLPLVLVPIDKQVIDRPYLQSEQQEFVLNTNEKVSPTQFSARLFKVVDAMNNQLVNNPNLCLFYTQTSKKDCHELVTTKNQLLVNFKEPDIVALVVKAAGYQTYNGNLILDKLDGSNRVYEIKLIRELTALSLVTKNNKNSLRCSLKSDLGSEILLQNAQPDSYYSMINPGKYQLNITNEAGKTVQSTKVNVQKGFNYLAISLTPDVKATAEQVPAQSRLPVDTKTEVTVPKNIQPSASLPTITGDLPSQQVIYFDQSEYVLRADAKQKLDSLAAWLINNPNRSIRIVGYSDNVGDARLNQTLSEYRARVTYGYLTQKGVRPEQAYWSAVGSRHAVTDNDTEEHRILNRRVEIKIMPAPQ